MKLQSVYPSHNAPVVNMIFNDKYTVAYDVMDGYNWIEGSRQENLDLFKHIAKPDFYFRRSIDKEVRKSLPDGCKMFPLGLNYDIKPIGWPKKTIKKTAKDILKNNRFLSSYFFWNIDNFSTHDFEFYPIIPAKMNILFLTRLWNPGDFPVGEVRQSVEEINSLRANYLIACKKEFGSLFLGGLHPDRYSKKLCKELVVSAGMTKKLNYLNVVKESMVCIATTGLHNSIGWKLGEYVAASRAIVSEPLHYEVPGDFKDTHHYLSFENTNELIEKIYFLIDNKEIILEMMLKNFLYYHRYLRPDMMVLNTLMTIEKETGVLDHHLHELNS